MNDININLKVIETPGGNGVQVESFEDSLRNNPFYVADINTLKLKVSGDGTWIGKRLHVVNIAYTIVN